RSGRPGGGAPPGRPGKLPSGRLGVLVDVLPVRAEVRAEHDVREEDVPEAVHRVLDPGAGSFIEVAEPGAAAGATGHVAVHADRGAEQRVVEGVAAAVDQPTAVVRRGRGVPEGVHGHAPGLVERHALATDHVGQPVPVLQVDHGGADVVVDVLHGVPLRSDEHLPGGPAAVRLAAVVVTGDEHPVGVVGTVQLDAVPGGHHHAAVGAGDRVTGAGGLPALVGEEHP